MKHFYVLLFLLFLLDCLSAQDANHNELYRQETNEEKQNENRFKNQINLNFGYNHGYLKDLNFSPLRYVDGGLLYGGSYIRKSKNHIFRFEAHYSADTTSTKGIEAFDSDYQVADVKFAFLQKNKRLSSDKMEFYFGGQYHFHILYLDWQYQESYSFFANHSFDASGIFSYKINNKSQLLTKIDLPILSLVVRPPYNGIDNELLSNNDEGNVIGLITDGTWGSWNKLLSYDSEFTYQYNISAGFQVTATYKNRYHNTFETNKFVHLQNQFLLGLGFNF